tara:strand:+ start:752 stop:1111 length:360 start_codon:yes stop_codon:yes gene_type:complete
MSIPIRLFSYELASASTDATVATLLYTAPTTGNVMVTGLWLAPSQGGTANYWRLHHVGEGDAPGRSNMLIYANCSERSGLIDSFHPVKIVLGPAENLYGHLNSGNGVTLTAYGLVPRNA